VPQVPTHVVNAQIEGVNERNNDAEQPAAGQHSHVEVVYLLVYRVDVANEQKFVDLGEREPADHKEEGAECEIEQFHESFGKGFHVVVWEKGEETGKNEAERCYQYGVGCVNYAHCHLRLEAFIIDVWVCHMRN